MASRLRLSRFATDPVCYMNVAGADGTLFPGDAGHPGDIGIHAMFGCKWSDVAQTGLKAAENLWVYEVALRRRIETRSALARAVANRRIFRTVTITFPSPTLSDDDPERRVAADPRTDTFKDVVFFWKHRCKVGLPFDRYCFAATAEENHKPSVFEALDASWAPAVPLDRRRRPGR